MWCGASYLQPVVMPSPEASVASSGRLGTTEPEGMGKGIQCLWGLHKYLTTEHNLEMVTVPVALCICSAGGPEASM